MIKPEKTRKNGGSLRSPARGGGTAEVSSEGRGTTPTPPIGDP